MNDWTYGAEHELADIPLSVGLPKNFGWDKRDVTIVNSNGIANDPSGKLYGFGGEINTPPTNSIFGQVEALSKIKALFPQAAVNYRSNLHVHIRIPGLIDDLRALKQVQTYTHKYMPAIIKLIEPLPRPTVSEFSHPDELRGAVRRWKRRRVSHQTFLPVERLEKQLAATTVAKFFEAEPPSNESGKLLWHFQPRLCVNLRQLLQTDTVEFRHFPGTLQEEDLRVCVSWCKEFMEAALGDENPARLTELARASCWPQFPAYVHWQECRYRATTHDGTLTKAQIKANIAAILAGEFDERLGSLSWQH